MKSLKYSTKKNKILKNRKKTYSVKAK
jgi:hypothetical protein